MKKKIYIGQKNGEKELKQAWQDIFQAPITAEELNYFLSKPKGTILPITENEDNQEIVYWVAVGDSKTICKEAWADFWPLLNDSILNWEIIEFKDDQP